jgi:hypothetical protein
LPIVVVIDVTPVTIRTFRFITLTIGVTVTIDITPAFFVGWTSICDLDPLLSDWVMHANNKIVIGVRLNDDPGDARGLLQTELEDHVIAVYDHQRPAFLWLL